MTVQEKQQERLQIREDTLAGRVPKRLFVWGAITLEACCQYAGVDLRRAHYDIELMDKAYSAVCNDFYFDALPIENIRYAGSYQILGAKNWILASNGAVQHPEIETMHEEDYDEFIADPYGTIVRKMLPRVCTHLDTTDPARAAVTMGKAIDCFDWYNGSQGAVLGRLAAEHGYAPGLITSSPAVAPFDFLSDQLRGFKSILMDCRRMPDKVEAAVNAILPLMVKKVLSTARPGAISFMPLHLAPYMNMKTFERLFWPSMEKLITEADKGGVAYYLFAEQDWTRYHEYLSKLPKSTIVRFEDGDPKLLKETVGKDHVISGFFDPTITLTKSKEECIDEAKRLFDTCGEGGRYLFTFDKNVMDFKSIDVKKLQAVLDWLHINATY